MWVKRSKCAQKTAELLKTVEDDELIELDALLLSHCSICWSDQDSTALCCTKHTFYIHTLPPSLLLLILPFLSSLSLSSLTSCSLPLMSIKVL